MASNRLPVNIGIFSTNLLSPSLGNLEKVLQIKWY